MTEEDRNPEPGDAGFDRDDLADSQALDAALTHPDLSASAPPPAAAPRHRHAHRRGSQPESDSASGASSAEADSSAESTVVETPIESDESADTAVIDSAALAAALDAEPGPARTGLPSGGGRAVARRGGKPPRRGKRRRKAPWWELPALVLFAIVIAVLVKTFVVQPFYIPSESMEKTLHGCTGCSGDRILVNKPIYDFRDPHPGDIVVFNAPHGWNDGSEPVSKPPSNPVFRLIRGFGQLIGFVPPDGEVLVKRVIATGGQWVKGVSTDGGKTETVSIASSENGPWRALNEPYVYMEFPDPSANFGPIHVPKGRLWVMGDHRNRSADSRYHCAADGSQGLDNASCDATEATVPISDVIGKAFVIAWPPSRWRTLGTPSTFTTAAASGALPSVGAGLVVFPTFMMRRRRRRRVEPRRSRDG
jgi:signal peptidase I